MKALHLFLAVIFTFSLCLAAAPADVLAVTDKKEVTAPADAPVKAAVDEKKKSTNAAKGIPKDVNINTADKAMLTLLPGIGPVTAEAILAYRKDNGDFKSIDELTKVKGIGDKTLVKLKPYLQTL